MKPKRVMLIAGEPSGDALAAELVTALKKYLQAQGVDKNSLPEFFGAGGPKMAKAGVKLALDMTQHAVIGLSDVIKNYGKFRRIFDSLLVLAENEKPDLIILVDFSGFNRRFAHAIRNACRKRQNNWSPKIVQYVSPQVWASRPSRADKMAKDVDLLLCLFPFEKEWYAKRTPNFRVEFVGHPIFDRYSASHFSTETTGKQIILLLPGSRRGEIKKHLPVMLEAAKTLSKNVNTSFKIVLPNDALSDLAKSFLKTFPEAEIQIGGLPEELSRATIALASTGTVLLECAYFGVPTVAMYKTSWTTYQIGKRIVQVKYLSMPNILADEEVYPEFVQDEATPENIANAALDLLNNNTRREQIKNQLAKIIASLGGPGGSKHAAKVILNLVKCG